MPIKQNSDGNPDGSSLGQSPSDKIGFYGAAPIAQQVLATGATTAQIVAALAALGLTRLT
jgi:hypothetical protein